MSVDFRERVNRVEALVGALEKCPDPTAREASRELVRTLLDLHAAGLTKVLELAGGDGTLIDQFADDELISSLLLLHGLHPHPATRTCAAYQALEQARPRFRSMGGDIDLIDASEEVVRLRIRGELAVRAVAEEAVLRAAPGAVVEIEEASDPIRYRPGISSPHGEWSGGVREWLHCPPPIRKAKHAHGALRPLWDCVAAGARAPGRAGKVPVGLRVWALCLALQFARGWAISPGADAARTTGRIPHGPRSCWNGLRRSREFGVLLLEHGGGRCCCRLPAPSRTTGVARRDSGVGIAGRRQPDFAESGAGYRGSSCESREWSRRRLPLFCWTDAIT